MMSLAKEGLARLNPQGCGMPMEDCDHGVISYTGYDGETSDRRLLQD